MSELERARALFWRAITHPVSVAAFLEEAGSETREEFHSTFLGSPAFPDVERVEVYARAYFYRLLDALGAEFPVVRASLGPDDFHDLVTDFLLALPSQSPNLHDLGARFPDFLARHERARGQQHLLDFARIELALAEALHAADATPLSAAELAEREPSTWPKLHWVPSASWVRATFDLRQSQLALREASALPTPVPCEGVLVWRRGHVPCSRPMSALERGIFDALRVGCGFQELCDVAERGGFDAMQLSQSFRGWLENELLAAGSEPSQSADEVG